MSDIVEKLRFCDPVMNISASDSNPIKYGIFTRRVGRDVEYMTNDGRTHQTARDNLKKSAINPADEIERLRAQVERLTTALHSACGYLKNADIDLATGAKKVTAQRTIQGGIKMVEAALTDIGNKAAPSSTDKNQSEP